MRLYLATVNPKEIAWAERAGLLDGIVATPAVLAAEMPQADPREILRELADETARPVFASVASLDGEEIVRGGKDLRRLNERREMASDLRAPTAGKHRQHRPRRIEAQLRAGLLA